MNLYQLQALVKYNLWTITVSIPSFAPQGQTTFQISSFTIKPGYEYYISIPEQHIYITKANTVPQQIQIGVKSPTTNPVIVYRLDKQTKGNDNYVYHSLISFNAQISFTSKISILLYLDNTYPINTKMFPFKFIYQIYQQKKDFSL